MNPSRNADPEHDPRSRFGLYRLCHCPTCSGSGKARISVAPDLPHTSHWIKCPDCRGEGRIRQEVASCESPEAVGVALVTLAREGEWDECPLGLLDLMPECERCEGRGLHYPSDEYAEPHDVRCTGCNGSGIKPTGTWLVSPWLPSARNVSDAGRVLARSKRK